MKDLTGIRKDLMEHELIKYRSPQSYMAKYLVVVVDMGITSEVMHHISFDDAKTAFGEVAYDHGCEPEEINKSNHYNVSIWEWTEDRYIKIYGD